MERLDGPETLLDVGPPERVPMRELRRDVVREKIAIRLTYAVIGTTVLPIVAAIAFPDRAAAIKEIATTIIPAVLGIYGTIIGFYFGNMK